MCLLLNLRGVNNTLNYPKDTQLNTPSLPMNLRYCSSCATGIGLLSLVIFFTQSISLSNIQLHRRLIRCPPWGGFEQLCFSALLKGQSLQRLSTLSSSSVELAETAEGASPISVNPCSTPAAPVRTWGTRPVNLELGGADRDRTGDPLLAKQVLSQLSYSPITGVVGLGRFELPTSPLSGVRSNQLSYRPAGCARVS